MTLTYDTAGRIVSMGDVAFGFDEATGRRISAKRSGEESATYTWSEAGRLEHFADPARDTSATHAYDGNGQRTTSVVTHGSVTTTTTWTYDGLTLLAYATERSDGATSALTYLTSEGGRPIAGVWSSSEASAPVRFSILTNDRGDVVALTDAAGEVFASYGYDAFGAPRPDLTTSRETSAVPHAETIAAEQPLRYAGYVFDTHSGLYYCSQRYYDPQTMQFLTHDPARADGEESAYQYCGGDPVGKVDPTGLHSSALGGHTHLWGDTRDMWWTEKRVDKCLWRSRWLNVRGGWKYREHDHLVQRYVGAPSWAFWGVETAGTAKDILGLFRTATRTKSLFGLVGSYVVSAIYPVTRDGRSGHSYFSVYYRDRYDEYVRAPGAGVR